MSSVGRRSRVNEDVYVASFSFDQHGTPYSWAFEVNLKGDIIRNIVGDAELEKKYGFNPRSQ